MAGRVLTEMQYKFAQNLAAGMDQSEAYRDAYPSARNQKISNVSGKASQMARNVLVQAQVEKLRAPVVRKLQYTLETAMEEGLAAFKLGQATQQVGAMVAAATLRAKLMGLLVEKREVKVTSFDNFDAQAKQTMIEAAQAELDRRRLLLENCTDIPDDDIKMDE